MLSFSFRRIALATVLLSQLGTQQYAQAIVPTCVSTAAQLQSALTAAATDHAPNYITLVNATYNFATPLVVNVSDGDALTIEGGYTDCSGGLPTAIPDNTVLVGVNGSGAYVSIVGNGGLTVRNLTFSGFKPATGKSAILMGDNDAGSNLHVENVAITGNGVNGVNDNILVLYPSGGLVFDDNIVHDNTSAHAAVDVIANYPALPFTLANNTVASNQSPGLELNTYSEIPTGLYNNILWNNTGNDLVLTDTQTLALNNTWHNSFFDSSSALVPASVNNSVADPKLTATYRLGATSPAINTGLPLPMALPLTDAAENLRVQGSAPDEGAYETSTNDIGVAHTYLVTSVNDSGILTLRQAILDANAAGVPARINFHIGASCGPQAIVLNSALPAITVPMLIDGYTQPGAAANGVAAPPLGIVSTNGTLCIFLAGAVSPNPGFGLRVASTAASTVHLEVRGIVFTLFATAAVDIAGGNGSWLHGNAFGETTAGLTFANNIGIQLDGGTATVIGGPMAADINLISNNHVTDGVGIRVTSTNTAYNTIANNSIGGDAAGTGSGAGNATAGIEFDATSHHIVHNNWIVANGGDGIRIDNSTFILVQTNALGSTFAGGLGNAGAGVHALNGAGDNWIGTTDPMLPLYTGGNTITGNGAAGVLIDVNAGVYNQATGNMIYQNAGLAIDLALPGPTPNTGSESTGPNRLLHKPVLTSAVGAPGSKILVTGSIATESMNNDRYVSIYASSLCGDAETLLGSAIAQGNASSTTISFSILVPAPSFGPARITATDDDYTAGVNNTSEISNSKKLSISDDVYNDDFDCY